MMLMLTLIIVAIMIVVLINPRIKYIIGSDVKGYSAGYEYVSDYNKYNSAAEDNGLGGKDVYIFGTQATDIAESGMSSKFTCKTQDGEWLISTGLLKNTEGASQKLNSATEIIVYGSYMGYSDKCKMPTIMADRIIIDGTVYGSAISYKQAPAE